ncbi:MULTISPECIES: AroM family protein [Thermoanaerobacter]|uniref:AroM family protein n=1 Tax=Thermoanaerobacter TaxID=1754 RepID=UPI00057330E6|nr:AroM family protein [Thermoanaerobacter sp. YS13]KHO62771.1 AroM protein [Thermoanaerobacter sp. YS13]
MKKLGMITIGQAPRTDVAPIIEKYLNGRAELIQRGVLDGLTKEYIEQNLYPEKGEYVLTTRLATGESVIISREKIQPILQDKIYLLEEEGINQILLLCTGEFPGLKTNKSYLIEPDRILTPTVKALVGNRQLGVIVPLEEQIEALKSKYYSYNLDPLIVAASPYKKDLTTFTEACQQIKDKVDIILLDCMGYTEEIRELVSEITELPVILSNALMAKLVSEMI